MADTDKPPTMAVEVRFWPADMKLVGTVQTWPREKAEQAIRDYYAVPAPTTPPETPDGPASLPPVADPGSVTTSEPDPAPVPAEPGDGEQHKGRRRTTDTK